MDLGCIDMGCVEKLRRDASVVKESSPKESEVSASKLGKNRAKDAVRSSINALNKLTSQISKPPRRKTSPINWFPRKKIEPYLKRKIKMLQEVDGMHSTLDETLGDSNPHYCRVLREKIAIREAAEKAVEARKAAMVEASWCRILHTARIGCKEAEARLLKAEHNAAEAIEAARALGVIMNDVPDFEQNHNKIDQDSSAKGGGGGSLTHNVSATFETAFEVDKQVAAAVKSAFVKLASCPSTDKDEFRELLIKISENPDTDENFNNCSDLISDCESEAGLELEVEPGKEIRNETKVVSCKKKKDLEKMNVETIVDEMLDRLRRLKEDELASLATIVATCGLNAALAEARNSKQHGPAISSADENVDQPHVAKFSNRMSMAHKRGTSDIELPSLDKFLVKHLTRLEREVLEAKNARKSDACRDNIKPNDPILPCADDASSSTDDAQENEEVSSDLGSILKRHSSKLEKEIEEAKKSRLSEMSNKKKSRHVHAKQEAPEIPSLDKFLVKRLSRLEKEVAEAKNGKCSDDFSSENSIGKENLDTNINDRNTDTNKEDIVQAEKPDKVLSSSRIQVHKQQDKNDSNYQSLDKILVKHISKLEKEKLEHRANEPPIVSKLKRKAANTELDSGEGSLDQVLVKHKSRLEREKTGAASFERQENGDNATKSSYSRRQAREQELQAAWGGLSLGNSMRPHVSRLQREKAAWLEAEENERNRVTEEV